MAYITVFKKEDNLIFCEGLITFPKYSLSYKSYEVINMESLDRYRPEIITMFLNGMAKSEDGNITRTDFKDKKTHKKL